MTMTSVFREIEDWGPSPEQKYAQTELNTILNEVIGELDPLFPGRLPVARRGRSLHGRNRTEILQVSEAAVKSRLLRARWG